ncbi:hypothetical protein SLA2020_242840 [Shorea laevis]
MGIIDEVLSALNVICGTSTFNCIDRHVSFDEDVSKLKRRFDKLIGLKEKIKSKHRQQECTGEEVTEKEKEWLEDVEGICRDVGTTLGKAATVKCYERYFVGIRVSLKIPVVEEMLQQGSSFSLEAPVPGIMLKPKEKLVGQQISIKEEILGYLMGDVVRMIGVWGIGGVGKTTIIKHVNDHLLSRENGFQRVIWVTVAYNFNEFEVQKKIAYDMGVELQEDGEQMRWVKIKKAIMGRGRFVLILDDVWENFSFSDDGILETMLQNGCKVVITSRLEGVCNRLGCEEIVEVQPLLGEEPLNLFLNRFDDDVLQDAELGEILKLIVEECAGLPLAIVVIAETMKEEGKPNIAVWRDAHHQLRHRVKGVNDMKKKIFERLKFSYDRLKDPIFKECFLYCSLFKEDYEFSKKELIEGWIDEGLIDKSLRGQDAYDRGNVESLKRRVACDRGNVILEKLEKICLLEKTVKRFVETSKMHDVVRDMAIEAIGPEVRYMVEAGMNLTEVPNKHKWAIDLSKVSLMANDISEIPVGLNPKCPSLSTLILSDNPLTEIPECFFEDMSGLKVLDLSRTKIKALPRSISKLKYLSALRLRWCNKLKCLPSLEKLVALKKLDLRWVGIEVVPQGMEMLVRLEYLDLVCGDLKEMPTGILSKLSSLQYFVATKKQGFTSVKINFEEVARLRKLEILKYKLEDMQGFNCFLSEFKNFQKLTAYNLVVGTMKNWVMDTNNPKYKCKLIIGGCDIGEKLMVPLYNLQHLQIHNCKNIRSSLNKTVLLENATKLGICIITCCEEIEYVVELDSSFSSSCKPVLDKLESLYLWDLPRLWALVRVEGVAAPPCVFSNLKILQIFSCLGMRKLLPIELLSAFQNLEVIWVNNCKQMEEIIASSDSDASSSNKFTFTFLKLKEFHLAYLPQLKSICSAKWVCDSIEEIWICGCPELKRIPVQLPLLDNGQPSPPPCLREIWIDAKSKKWWESVVEWDHSNAKNILQPFLRYN